MRRDNNLIRYGIKKIMIHPITNIDLSKTDGTAYTYGTAFSLPGAQSLNLPSNWASNDIFADDILFAEQKANLGYAGTQTHVKLTEQFEEEILGDVNGQENSDVIPKDYGMSFQFTGDKNNGRCFLYHVSLTKRPDIIHNTKSNQLSVDGDTMNINVKPRLDTHDVKVKCYPGDPIYDSILTTPPNPVSRAALTAVDISGLGEVEVESTITLTATTTPNGQAVTWSSLDEDNATVTSGGVVTGEAAGTATIKCALTSDPTVYDLKTIIVNPKEVI